uniref:Formin-like protein n=1 Tax=Nelumbo nucifera TaxID=4432 RepID=A0A822XII4_NELNU|nr:TPA_asm: hypothetical protein HUJ06_022797 [Nelumbo nucifera]
MEVKFPYVDLLFFVFLALSSTIIPSNSSGIIPRSQILSTNDGHRRILHQPLFPVDSTPPAAEPPPAPSGSSVFPNPDQPFFPEVPTGPTPDQTQTTTPSPPANNASTPVTTPAAQQASPTKMVAVGISVGIVTLGMLSALAFFLYRQCGKHTIESQKLVGGNSQRFLQESGVPSSDFLYLGTMEPSNRRGSSRSNKAIASPYHKLSSVSRSELHRPSPELQPLPPLPRAPQRSSSPTAMWPDEESFYTPQGSSVGNSGSPCTSVTRQTLPTATTLATIAKGIMSSATSSTSPSWRSSPKSRFSVSPPDDKHVFQNSQPRTPSPPKRRAKFPSPPSPPNLVLPHSINDPPPKSSEIPPPPPPPPPPAVLGKERPTETKIPPKPVQALPRPQSEMPILNAASGTKIPVSNSEINQGGNSSKHLDSGDDLDGAKPRLKPLHWDKVRATSDRAMVWDRLNSSSFQLNEDMIETLFGCNSTNVVQKEANRRTVLPRIEQENRILDPKKSQNIAILLRALNVTRDEVTEALLDGNPDGLGVELLETLVKMAPTKQEELKLKNHNGDMSKLGSAERFLKAVLDIPFAFKRIEAMLYRANFDTEVKYLRKSFETLEAACEDLKNSRLFLKLLEAVLRTGNRMNVGTNRGDARAFKLDTLLKLVDVKGVDGKTTLLHFVVQEIIRSEGTHSDPAPENLPNKLDQKAKEEDFRKQGLNVVAGLSRELENVKKAAGMDSDVLSSYLSKLEMGLEKVRSVLQYEKSNKQGNFFEAMKLFLKEAEEEILRVKGDERKALGLVKEVTEYFHGDAAREEAHPFRIFVIVRDFLLVLDQVCREVGKIQQRAKVGSARTFRISASASLPVLNRYSTRQSGSSDEDSLSP